MPIYEYLCKQCNAIDEVKRRMADSGKPWHCHECKAVMIKKMSVPQVITKGEEIKYLHPAFGTVMTDSQAKKEAKSRGWIEVGNEDVAKHTPAPTRTSYDTSDYFL